MGARIRLPWIQRLLNEMIEHPLRPPVSEYISYISDPTYGKIGDELYRSEADVFLRDASTRCGRLLRADLLAQLSRISCFLHRVRPPAHATCLAAYAAHFGINSGILGELYWWGSRRPESPWSIIRGYVLDVAVDGRTHRRGLFEKAFAHCGSFLPRRIDGGFASYLYHWAQCIRRPTSVPDRIIVGMGRAERDGGTPPVDKAPSPLLEGPPNLHENPNHLSPLKGEIGAAPHRHRPYELCWRLGIPRMPPIDFLSSAAETGRMGNANPQKSGILEVKEPLRRRDQKSATPNATPGNATGRPDGGLGAGGSTYPSLFSDIDMAGGECDELESARVDDPGSAPLRVIAPDVIQVGARGMLAVDRDSLASGPEGIWGNTWPKLHGAREGLVRRHAVLPLPIRI